MRLKIERLNFPSLFLTHLSLVVVGVVMALIGALHGVVGGEGGDGPDPTPRLPVGGVVVVGVGVGVVGRGCLLLLHVEEPNRLIRLLLLLPLLLVLLLD